MTPAVRDRDTLPDLLRAFALIGIVLVNVELFSYGMASGYPETVRSTLADQSLVAFIFGVFTMKSYSLFSLMFGAGLGYQLASAERAAGLEQSDSLFRRRYFRRMAGLFLIGLIHAIFLFSGDILVTYAVLGCVLYLFRNSGAGQLLLLGVVFIGLQVLVLLSLSGMMWGLDSLPAGELRDEIFAEIEAEKDRFRALDTVFQDGGFLEIAFARLQLYPTILQSIPMVQGMSALGFFLMGLAFFKRNWLKDPSLALWRWSRFVLLPAGLLLSLPAGWMYATQAAPDTPVALLALTLNMIASLPFTLGVVGWFVAISQTTGGPVQRFLALGGSASLTAYLLQSVILSFIFLPYGLGLFGRLTVGTVLLIALGAGIVSVLTTAVFRVYMRRGPVEILLRRWVYAGESQTSGSDTPSKTDT